MQGRWKKIGRGTFLAAAVVASLVAARFNSVRGAPMVVPNRAEAAPPGATASPPRCPYAGRRGRKPIALARR